jgi:crotonobetaine/carnitine-CoA ligase
VPINTGFRGEALHHALRISGAKLLVADPLYRDLLPETPAIGLDDIPTIGAIPLIADNALSDTAQLLFTSGSTGPSKACRIPHGYVLGQPAIFCRALGIRATDTLFAPFPLFHVDGAIFTVAAAIHAGATAALAPRFSASRFWDECRRHGATVIDYMGATLAILYRRPPSPGDRDHQVRLAWGVPAPPFADEFERRFGLELVEVYGLSDAGIVLANTPGEPRRAGSCGKAIPPFDVRIHDEQGVELPDGEIGEIVIRSPDPNLVTTGYEGDPAATEAAIRDVWFLTVDLARRDGDGYFHFVGRLKDIIRRRGENISAFDLEQALLAHPDVAEAAAYGVPSELTEEDVMVAIVPRAGATLDPAILRHWLGQRLAPHMLPRYVRIAAGLPRTPTEKVAKHALIAAGITADAIDFETRTARANR